jgi:ubiquitin C-terminal hydrolase
VRPAELQTLLADFEMPEFLAAQDDYTCAVCGDLVQKTLQVQPVGQALLIHLKRFDSRGRRLGDDVTFPRELIVGTARYAFAAVVEHQGHTIREGHYVAHVQSRKLLCCNDATVTETTWERIASRQAYVLAYVRVDP